MKIGEHSLRDHLRLLAPLFGLITAVWALRLVLYSGGAPMALVRIFSVGVAGSVSVLVAAFLIHFKRFGSYASVGASAFLLVFYSRLLIVLAIAFAAVTRTGNVFVASEFSFGMTHAQNIVSHVTVILVFQSLMAAAMGCVLLWMLRWLVPVTPPQGGGA
jgi:hypothetical protein